MQTYHENTPEDYETHNGHGLGWSRESLSQSREDDDDQLKSVHAFTTDNISEVTKAQLTDDSSTRSSNLNSRVGIRWDRALGWGSLPVNYTQHGGDQVDGEDIVGIREETNTSDHTGADVVPSERSLVDLSEGQSSSLIGILNMGEVIVEVVEGSIAASGLVELGSHFEEEGRGVMGSGELTTKDIQSKGRLYIVELVDDRSRQGRDCGIG